MDDTIKEECLYPIKCLTGAESILLYLKNLKGSDWVYYLQTFKEAIWLGAAEGVDYIEQALKKRELLEAFVFNKTQQVHIFKQGQHFQAAITREIENADAKPDQKTDFIENKVVLWGSYGKTENGFYLFEEGRGMVTRVSEKIELNPKPVKGQRIALVQRDYIHFDEETLNAGFHHCRFITLTIL